MRKIYFIFILILLYSFINLNPYALGYGVGKNECGKRPNLDIEDIINNNGYTIGKDTKEIYLTFDCGYEQGYTKTIIETLNELDVKATFFITGHYLNTSLDIVKMMIDNNHLVCNHTYHHKDFTKESNEEILNDISKLEKEYKDKLNIDMPKIIRPPRGEYDKRSMELLNNNGYKTVFWSLAFKDWEKDKYIGNHYSYNNVIKRIHNGAIILLHSVSKDNMIDLYDIITELKLQNYTFNTVDNL